VQAELDHILLTEVAPLRSEPDVARYLDQLVARAREKRALPVTIVQPGFQAIRRLDLPPDRVHALEEQFEGRLAELRRELLPEGP
jgi:hypothetical protein